MPKRSYVDNDERICVNTTSEELNLRPLTTNLVRCIQRMAVNTGSTKATIVTFGVRRGSTYYYLGSAVQAADKAIAQFTGTVWVTGEWQPFALVYGGTSGQLLSLFVYGYLAESIG